MPLSKIVQQHTWLVRIWYMLLAFFVIIGILVYFSNGVIAFIASIATLYTLVHRFIFQSLERLRTNYLPYLISSLFQSKKLKAEISFKQQIPSSIFSLSGIFRLSGAEIISRYRVHVSTLNNLVISQMFIIEKNILGSNLIRFQGYFAVCDLPSFARSQPAIMLAANQKRVSNYLTNYPIMEVNQLQKQIDSDSYTLYQMSNPSKKHVQISFSREFNQLVSDLKEHNFGLTLTIKQSKVYMNIHDCKKTAFFDRDILTPLAKQQWNYRQSAQLKYLIQLQAAIQNTRI